MQHRRPAQPVLVGTGQLELGAEHVGVHAHPLAMAPGLAVMTGELGKQAQNTFGCSGFVVWIDRGSSTIAGDLET